MLLIRENKDGLIFKIFVQPKSSKTYISGLYGDALKIKLTAPPVDGAANKMCVKYLAKLLKVSKSSIEIISGHTSRSKGILVKYSGKGTIKGEGTRIKNLLNSFL
ncbi:MAG: YggU family protein [Desulfobacterales bacterium]|jgi:uncharacterized protein|nr:YggU family protein [Desulfobacteraceae bacterium]MBT7085478.1 YggU family protein [Desulfobacterales bacterium]MBT7698477.1 YggU family protein [Desulfobacterales bacterium]